MTLLSPSASRGGAQPPDDIDKWLRAFFKAQMPHPWPSPEAPAPRRVAPPPVARPAPRWPLMRSRLALAASVALLATGLLFLAGAFQGRMNPAAPPIHMDGSANRENDPIHKGTQPLADPHDAQAPPKLKIDESLIQEPDGTKIEVKVIDWPVSPK
jgi:hypothetical protein